MRRTFVSVMQDAFRILWKDIKDLKWAIIFIIAYFVLGKNYLYSLCPMVMITGFPCPGCGLTRAGMLLLKFDFAGAFRLQPCIYPVAVYILLFGWNRYIRGRRMGRGLKFSLIVLMAFVILFYIWRMAYCFPGEPPMSYYERNLFGYVFQ